MIKNKFFCTEVFMLELGSCGQQRCESDDKVRERMRGSNRPLSFVPEVIDTLGSNIKYMLERRSENFSIKSILGKGSHVSSGLSCCKTALLTDLLFEAKRAELLVLADTYEGSEDSRAPQNAVKGFSDLWTLGNESTHKDVVEACNGVCTTLDQKLEGTAILLGAFITEKMLYIFNHGAGMAFLVRKKGDFACLTDYVLPDQEGYSVRNAQHVPGGILQHDHPLRVQPEAQFADSTRVRASLGIGYPKEEISSAPLITRVERVDAVTDSYMPHFEKGEYLVMITRDAAQNVAKIELEAAWQKLSLKREEADFCQQAAASLAAWFEARASEKERNITVVVKPL